MTIANRKFPSIGVDQYNSVRNSLKTGDLLFCSGTHWASRLIQRATQSVWSHVAFIARLDVIDRIVVLESVESQGVRSIPLSRYLTNYSDGRPYPGGVAIARHKGFQASIKPGQALERFGQFAVDRFGYAYDRNEIIKIAARIARSHIPFSEVEKRALDRDNEYICSEYVWECYRQVGIEIPADKRGFIAPSDFAKSPDVSLLAVLQDQNGGQARD